MTLYFIHIELKTGLNIKTEEEINKIKAMKNMQEMSIIENKDDDKDNKIDIIDKNKFKNNKLNIKSNINTKDNIEKDKKSKKKNPIIKLNIIYSILNFLMSHPNFNYEIERIISILWTYYYRNYYSLGMYIVLFCSFFFVDIIKNKFLILFILTPILLITIGSFHISNIDGIIENLTSDDKTFYSKFAIRKYRYILGSPPCAFDKFTLRDFLPVCVILRSGSFYPQRGRLRVNAAVMVHDDMGPVRPTAIILIGRVYGVPGYRECVLVLLHASAVFQRALVVRRKRPAVVQDLLTQNRTRCSLPVFHPGRQMCAVQLYGDTGRHQTSPNS